VPSQTSAGSQTPAEGRHVVPAAFGVKRQKSGPATLTHSSLVHVLLSLQSAFVEHWSGVTTQSDASEFGDCDGYEQVSMCTPFPVSPVSMQQSVFVSWVKHDGPLHCVWVVFGGSGNTSATPPVTVQVDVHVVRTAFVQFVGRSSSQV
jgi:hypothetical protein